MKKKTLLLTLLALAILTSITAGTLAVYTKSATIAAEVNVKKFSFAAAGKVDNLLGKINLAPTQKESYSFSVKNYEGDNGSPAEVPLTYTGTINFVDAKTKMPGLVAVLTDGNNVETRDDNGVISFTSTMAGNTAVTQNYVVTLTWVANDTKEQQAAGENKNLATTGLKIDLMATQAGL